MSGSGGEGGRGSALISYALSSAPLARQRGHRASLRPTPDASVCTLCVSCHPIPSTLVLVVLLLASYVPSPSRPIL